MSFLGTIVTATLGDIFARGVMNGTNYDFASLTLYLGMRDSTGTEFSGGSYARQIITFDPVAEDTAGSFNDSVITFTNLPTGNLSQWAIYTHATDPASIILYFNNAVSDVATPISISAGDDLTVDIGSIGLRFS